MNKRLFVFLCLIFAASCEDKDAVFSFNYNTILNREFRSGTGRRIPVAYEQAVEIGGDISSDGKYLYYSSNRESGNFDIYMRDLNDIAVVRIIGHSAKDTEPCISPDGKQLVFVSNREDPEGDIYIVKINPAKVDTALDAKAVNLTRITDENGTVQTVKDSSPVWSPDGESIAFMSKRDGLENIWLMDAKGNGLKQLTVNGGLYPRFSPDGEKLIFVSYREPDSDGDIYIKDLAGGEEKKAVGGRGIKLFPGFIENGSKIIYTLIADDTNGDGKLSLEDRGLIMYYNIADGETYPLTLPSENCFNAKWLTTPWSNSHDGLLMFSDVESGNINVNIIPGYGIIPKRTKASYQYALAVSYDEEYDDPERYLMALRMTYYFFGSKKDNDSQIYTGRALSLLWNEYVKKGDKRSANEIEPIIAELSKNGNLYVQAQYSRILAGGNTKKAVSDLKSIISEAKADKANSVFLPYLEEDLAKLHIERRELNAALNILSDIKANYPKYEEIASVHMEYALLADRAVSDSLSDSAVYVLESGRNVQKVKMNNHFISLFEAYRNEDKKLALLDGMLQAYSGKKRVCALLHYLKALSYKRLNKNNDMLASLSSSAEMSSINDLMYYNANLLMGLNWLLRDTLQSEKYMFLAVTNYKRYFSDESYRQRVQWLIDFYERSGSEALDTKNYSGAVSLFERYRRLIKYIYTYRYFPEMYKVYGPRAHVLYADAVSLQKPERGIDELESEYNTDLLKARIESDKAYIYGMAYIYTMKAMANEKKPKEMFKAFYSSIENLDWALFIDDSFVDPYILKSWIYQYADLRRNEDKPSLTKIIDRYFPNHLWEANIPLLEKALIANDEIANPEHAGNIHLNIANNYFLLINYPRALTNYEMAEQYKKNFDSRLSHALFKFHLAYCYWQNGEIDKARREMEQADYLYGILAEQNTGDYAWQFYIIYKYYALFSRLEENYEKAIDDYRRVLSFTAQHGIEIDRARYYQEIGWCYYALNRYSEAEESLAVADRLLSDKSYPDKEENYKLTFRLFYLLRFRIWDLGVDMAVIGDNKIFNELNTRNKKLLNLSMHESIQAKRSDYAGAAGYLEKKIGYLQKRKSSADKEALIITYNNLGYYYSMSGRYDKAAEFFSKAWEQSKKDEFLEGSFTSILNLTNMYVSIIERDPSEIDNADDILSGLAKRISDFVDDYQSESLKKGSEELKTAAKKQKRDVTPEETAALERTVAANTKEIYYKADIALGVLTYYRAELERNSLTKNADDIYSSHKKLYDMYGEALSLFSNALEIAKEKEDRLLTIKLLLNAGSCRERMGASDEAYSSFLEAKEASEELNSALMLFRSSAALGLFLKEQSDRVKGSDARSIAESNLKQAAELVKEAPLMYNGCRETVERVFDGLTDVYLSTMHWEDAFVADEEHSAFMRLMLIAPSAGYLYSKERRRAYEEYADLTDNLRKTYADFENGMGNEKKLKACRNALVSYAASNPSSSYWTVVCPKISSIKGLPVVRLLKSGGIIHILVLNGGKLYHQQAYNISDAAKALSRYSSGINLIFNKTACGIIMDSRPAFAGVRCVLITSIKQAAYEIEALMNTAYRAGGGLSEDLPITVKNDPEALENPSGYDIIADRSDKPLFTAEYLFSHNLNPSLLISFSEQRDFNSLFKLAEAACASGAHSFALFYEGFGFDAEKTVRTVLESGSGVLMFYSDEPVLCFGKNIIRELSKSDESIYAAYLEKLNLGNAADAEVELIRWHKTADRSSANTLFYAGERIALLLMQNDAAGAETFLSRELELSFSALAAYRAWIKLYVGDVKAAKSLIEEAAGSADYAPLKAVADISAGGNMSSPLGVLREYAAASAEGFLIPKASLVLLAAGYLNLAGKSDEAGKLLSGLKIPYANVRETALMLLTGGGSSLGTKALENRKKISDIVNKYKINRPSFSATMNLIDSADDSRMSRAAIILLIEQNGGMDDFFSELLLSDILDDIRSNSYWQDRIALDIRLADFLNSRGEYGQSLSLLNNLSGLAPDVPDGAKRQIVTEKTAALLALGRYEDAYRAGLDGEKLFKAGDDGYVSLQLFLLDTETRATAADAGLERAEGLLGLELVPLEKFRLRLFQARIELKRISRLDRPSEADGLLFNRLYLEAVELADKNLPFKWLAGDRALYTEIADAYINFRFRTGDAVTALSHAEIKKQILMKADFHIDEKNSFTMLNAKDLHKKMKSMANGEIIFYIIRSGNSLILWAIGKDIFSTAVCSEATALESSLKSYREAAYRLTDTSAEAKKIGGIFSEFLSHIERAESIYICADEFTEQLPLEIAVGEEGRLFEDKGLFFISSMNADISLSTGARALRLLGRASGSLNAVEEAALSESGMKIGAGKASFVHAYQSVSADREGQPKLLGTDYADAAVPCTGVYLRSLPYGCGEFALYNRKLGISVCLINNAETQGLNTAHFLDAFYGGLAKGLDVKKAFGTARLFYKNGTDYAHPAYWSRIRLYIN